MSFDANDKHCNQCDSSHAAEVCPADCTHEDITDGYCDLCGEDRTEWLAMAAYDYAKGMKYDD